MGQLELTDEERAEIKECLLNMHSKIDHTRGLLAPPPRPKEVSVVVEWVRTGKWDSLRDAVKLALTTIGTL